MNYKIGDRVVILAPHSYLYGMQAVVSELAANTGTIGVHIETDIPGGVFYFATWNLRLVNGLERILNEI